MVDNLTHTLLKKRKYALKTIAAIRNDGHQNKPIHTGIIIPNRKVRGIKCLTDNNVVF